jgi:superfamily II DNA or RNA helicase
MSKNGCATGSCLSRRGYTVLKNQLDDNQIKGIKKDLTVAPYVPEDYQMGPKVQFKLFLESNTKIYVPKWYGIEQFGPPESMKIPDGKEVELTFTGSLRPEQAEPVQKLLDGCLDPAQMGGVLNVFCGGGKTTMALYTAARLARKTMIVVHKDFLMNQWKERIEQFLPGARIGSIKAKVVDVDDKDIVIASLQSLSMKDYADDTFSDFGTVIIDEVHHTSAEVFSQALRKVTFRYTIGLSATVSRKDGLSKVFLWYLGPIVFRASKRKDTVDVTVERYFNHSLEYSGLYTIRTPNGDKPNMAKMINNICSFEPRNDRIVEIVGDIFATEPKRKMLILSDRRSHLYRMAELIESKLGITCGIYVGGMKQDALALCETKQIILATFAIASEGYDQPGLDTLVLASPRSDVIQSVGRILRDKECDRVHVPRIVDVVDMFSMFERQSDKRAAFYNSCKYDIKDKHKPKAEVKLPKGKCMF